MYQILESSIHIFENLIMYGFFWYSLVLIVLKLTDSIKPKLLTIDRQICQAISILGIVYILAVILICFAYREAISMESGIANSTSGFNLLFWFLVLCHPLLLFMFTQLLRVDKMSESMPFRGITAILFLFIR
ncbi:MAG: hypothetical protein AB8B65_01770 [Kordia sp.]|uniref:hypothetical protein n=1 Tax=Kordia sp. TaxID=1965332 RepID=UPI00385FEA66